MSKLALARKYRPRKLSSLIGQEGLRRTMTNAIASGRVAHAYVLSGPRGTGKTSTARILARALNCESGPTPEPCGTCDICLAIIAERNLDVTEMDAASQTGVDDVRQLLESIPYAPVQSRHKVYIIDEAHMLSKNAWNALLKTLEEPPAHVVFLFCTTEPRKIPVTVLSRCQRFQLGLISDEQLFDLFKEIANAEGAVPTLEALTVVVKAAEGSARDGLSVLDQLIATFPDGATGAEARDLIGLPDEAKVAAILDHALGGNAAAAIKAWRALIDPGIDPMQAIKDMMAKVHDMSIFAAAPEAATALGLVAPSQKKVPYERLQNVWSLLAKAAIEMGDLPDRRSAGDMAVLRIAA
jgi:DNA polymerase-3 subunit gamma/tau